MNAPPPAHPTDQTLHAYGVGALEDALASSVDAHLEDCPDCRRRVAELSGDSFVRRLRAGAGSTPVDAAPSVVPASRFPKMPAAENLPPELADQYELVRELGRGGMGVVWLARNKLLDRPEALKVLNKETLERRGTLDRFLREIRAVARLSHENVVRAYSALQLGDALVFVLEYVDGMDLARLVKQRGPLPVQHACYFAHQAALGLQHAHERGMVHRDIKPGNLILQRQGQRAVVKVLDFGLAKALSEQSVDGSLTREGQMLGTPDYIAPEQTLDAQKADIRADIYSLGCTLYFLLAGEPPFQGISLYEVLQAHHSTDAKPLNLVRPEVPAELAAVVATMMAKDPARRFQTPREVAQALTPFFKPASLAARPAVPPAEPPPNGTQPRVAPHSSEPRWAALIEFKETERSAAAPVRPEPTSAAPPTPRRPGWRRLPLAAGLLLAGAVLAWFVVLRLRTQHGELVFTDLPRGAVVTSDGTRVTVAWTGADGPAKATLTVGKHTIGVRINGVEVRGEEVTIARGLQTPFTVALEPRVPAAPTKRETETRAVALFNGRDLSGWRDLLENGSQWEVVDGDLEGRGGGERRPAVLVLDDRALTNFKLRFKARYVRPGGGWVELRRTASGVSGLNTNCYAFAQGAWPSDRPPAGSGGAARNYVYGTDARGTVDGTAAPLSTNRWHQYEFVVENNRITTSIDGAVSSEFVDEDELYPSGSIALAVNGLEEAQFRDIELAEIPDDKLSSPRSPIQGRFAALFNGKNSSGWSSMRDSGGTWGIADGVLEGRGGGVTGKPGVLVCDDLRFTNFRLRFQARYPENGFGWVELRRAGTTDADGFYAVAHAVHPRPAPAEGAYVPVGSVDRARHSRYEARPAWDYQPERTPFTPGDWHRLEVKVVGSRITTSVDGAVVGDYTDPEAVHASGLIALACGAVDSKVQYKNVLIEVLPDDAVASEPKAATDTASASVTPKEIPAPTPVTASPGFTPLFNGADLNGWKVERGGPGGWRVEDGHLAATALGGPMNQSFLLSETSCGDFVLRFEFWLPTGSDSGVVFWAEPGERAAFPELNLRNVPGDAPGTHARTGAVRWSTSGKGADYLPPDHDVPLRPASGWNAMELAVREGRVSATLNGSPVVNADLKRFASRPDALPALRRRSGRVGFQAHTGAVKFRNIEIKELERASNPAAATAPTPGVPNRTKRRGRAGPLPRQVTNSLEMNLNLIPAGMFLMGSPKNEGEPPEHPQHPVTISRPFYMGIHEVTQKQYAAVMIANPSQFRDDESKPVERVSWIDAVTFCNTLSEREGLRPFYRIDGQSASVAGGDGYRLPTEAEWEYACRAGTTTPFPFPGGETALGRYAWYGPNARNTTHPVGQKEPNAVGLFDMLGNVWEWCHDVVDRAYYAESPAVDPSGPDRPVPPPEHVCRGGTFNNNWSGHNRSAYRGGGTGWLGLVGFRVARSTSGTP